MSTNIERRLEQIAKISQNARPSWFGLLALLVFVGVTLMGHRDSDFFAFGAETDLPLVGISVPTVSFFIVAPALAGVLHIYLHIYLRGLWVVLAKCPARVEGDPLEECAYPTVLCTSALVIRCWLRRESVKPVEGTRVTTVAITVFMVWFLGPLVLGILWWKSMPYHHEWLTLWTAFWLWLMLTASGASLLELLHVMRASKLPFYSFPRQLFRTPASITSPLLLLVLVVVSWDTTESGWFLPLTQAHLPGVELSRKPANWVHYEFWLEDWDYQFRNREGLRSAWSNDRWPDPKSYQFKRETGQRWTALTQSLDSPDLQHADLRRADLREAFLSGADLRKARLDIAFLTNARLEGTNLAGASLKHTNFSGAWLEGANLSGAQAEGLVLWGARLDYARLTGARLDSAYLSTARLDHARLIGVRLNSADLSSSQLNGADLRNARLNGADLSKARLNGADLSSALGLTQSQLDHACGDQYTRLPDGLTVPNCAE